MQERGKSGNLKLATYLKEMCDIASAAEEVSSKTLGSCKWYYVLVGGLEHVFFHCLVVWNMFFPYIGNHHPI